MTGIKGRLEKLEASNPGPQRDREAARQTYRWIKRMIDEDAVIDPFEEEVHIAEREELPAMLAELVGPNPKLHHTVLSIEEQRAEIIERMAQLDRPSETTEEWLERLFGEPEEEGHSSGEDAR